MIGMGGAKGIRIKLFSGSHTSTERIVNEFLEEHEGNIVDIQLGSNEKTFDVMVVYREEIKGL